MSEEQEIIYNIEIISQKCFQSHPVIILGSGASAIHGLRGMAELARYLVENIKVCDGPEGDAWLLIRTALVHGDGLEDVLVKTPAPFTLVKKIVDLTWMAIAEDDIALMNRAIRKEEKFYLSDLITGMFKSTHMFNDIVTTNYDRVAEYASDIAGYYHATGFSPGIIRNRENGDLVTFKRGAHQTRVVRIWKVHGSLDWFSDSTGRVISLPISTELVDYLTPMIVTPGVSKYERTHDEPFRSAIQGADRALSQAESFLCVGYGFRDRHIQPKIVERCRQRNVPIVILARTLTNEAKDFLINSAGQSYMALEKDGDGTRVFLPAYPAGRKIDRPDLWSLENFNKMVL